MLKHHFSIYRDLDGKHVYAFYPKRISEDYCSNLAMKKENWFVEKENNIIKFMNCLKETLNLL